MVSKICFYTWTDLMTCIAQYLPICKENVHSGTTPYIVYMVICQWCATSLTNNHIYSIRWRNNDACVIQCFPFRSAIPKEIMPLLKIYVRHIDRYLPEEYVQEFQGDLCWCTQTHCGPATPFWQQRCWSKLVQVMVCFLMALSHYLNAKLVTHDRTQCLKAEWRIYAPGN